MDYSSLPVFASAEVVVCGGGAAGAFAAKSAADEGADVLVVEQFGSLGGTATNGLTMPVMHTHIASNPQCSYVSKLVRDKLFAIGGCDDSGANFDPFLLKVVLEEICVESGVKLLFHTFIADVITENGKVTALVVANKKGLGLVKGKVFIDGTGDGDVCVRAGAGYTKGNPETGKNQPISLRYIISNVNFEEFGNFINEEKKRTGVDGAASYYDGKIYVAVCATGSWTFSELFDKAIAAGDLDPDDKAYWQGFTVTGRADTIAFNSPEFFDETDGTDPDVLTKTQVMGKKRALRQLMFCKKYLKGFEKAYISDISAMVGIRESRNITTEYVLTAEDLLCRRKFADMFCQSNYPVDIHGKKLSFNEKKYKDVDDGKPWYEIPFRSLVVKGFDNLLVTGRCLGAEFLAQSSLRVQQSARSSGEAAGIAAAMALKKNLPLREINGADVREEMIRKGAEYAVL
ncbi:MAG: FAD-dependent oxidoreductase [Clostridia bacterium]|nr:FAD-dependent oxidoreductase [Clostridia bacterium]